MIEAAFIPISPVEKEPAKLDRERAKILRTVEISLGSVRAKNTIGAYNLDDPRHGIYLVLTEPQLIIIRDLLQGKRC